MASSLLLIIFTFMMLCLPISPSERFFKKKEAKGQIKRLYKKNRNTCKMFLEPKKALYWHFHFHAVTDKAKQAELKAYTLSHSPLATHTAASMDQIQSETYCGLQSSSCYSGQTGEPSSLIVLLGNNSSPRTVVSPNSSVKQTGIC